LTPNSFRSRGSWHAICNQPSESNISAH
jgi:hypothetical protein